MMLFTRKRHRQEKGRCSPDSGLLPQHLQTGQVRGTLHAGRKDEDLRSFAGNIRSGFGVRSCMGGERWSRRATGLDRAVCNPFYVFGLTPAARRSEITLRYRALKDTVQTTPSMTFETPIGPQPLDSSTLEQAYAELRDADARLEHELRYVPLRGQVRALSVVRDSGGER
ncbi:MAG: hypothetical protein AAGA54_11395 [Myxococcota bacterium]